jgi:hypothetical protein
MINNYAMSSRHRKSSESELSETCREDTSGPSGSVAMNAIDAAAQHLARQSGAELNECFSFHFAALIIA